METPEQFLDLYVTPLFKFWEEQTGTFFFDLFASRWRIFEMLQEIEATYWEEPLVLAGCQLLWVWRGLFSGSGERGPKSRSASPQSLA